MSEEIIQNKIQQISNSYLSFTGKNSLWKSGITLSEYQELRLQAIAELEKGIFCEEAELKIRHEEKPKPRTENQTITAYSNHLPEEEHETISDNVMDKFEKLKDL